MSMIHLRRFDPSRDYPVFYRVYSDYNEQHNLFDLVNLNSPERFPTTFEKALSRNYRDTLIIEESATGNFVGFLISYGYSPNDGHIKIMGYIEKPYRSCGYGGIAVLRFMEMLFKHYNLRKIYSEVYAFNHDSMIANEKTGFAEEARLLDYRFYNGKYLDFIIYAMTRENFMSRYEKLMDSFGRMVADQDVSYED